ncbi:MAG: FAD:protein FMN transferase [Myxococcota bacterium]
MTWERFRPYAVPGTFVVLLFVALWWRRPSTPVSSKTRLVSIAGRIFGTTYQVKVVSAKDIEKPKLQYRIRMLLHEIDMQMSTYKKQSVLSRFNRWRKTEPFPVSSALTHVVREAKRIAQATGGAFDVTIGPMVNLWGFGPKPFLRPPPARSIADVRRRIGHEKLQIHLKDSTLRKTHPSLYVDLSAIAKGYAVDRVTLLLQNRGFRRTMVEIGGELRVQGTNAQNQPWRIGIEKPVDAQQQVRRIVALRDAAMATSGNYRNYRMLDGRRVSHIIDPRTAQPVPAHLAAVSVIHRDCMTADALATALFVLGPVQGFALAKKQGWAALFQLPKAQGVAQKATPNFQKWLDKTQTSLSTSKNNSR